MSEKLSEVSARIDSIDQLSAVTSAMRGIAVTRSREAHERLRGINAYARTIAEAIGQAIALVPSAPSAPPPESAPLLIALCAEQGFAGDFSGRVLSVAGEWLKKRPDTNVFVIGDRGAMIAEERKLTPHWSTAMITHLDGVEALANRVADRIYSALVSPRVTEVLLVHAESRADEVVTVARHLIPFDFGRFPVDKPANPPLLTLHPELLLAGLAEEYVFAELCEAIVLSFAAENDVRARAMTAAKRNISEMLETLTRHSMQLRQNAITDEIIELSKSA